MDYLLICDGCDSQWHTYCLEPPLIEVPPDSWFCSLCSSSNARQEQEENGDEVKDDDANGNYTWIWSLKD